MKLRALSVSETNSLIKRTIETNPMLSTITVFGEASNVVKHSSGHVYFALKDEKSRLSCVMFKGDFSHSKLSIKDGDKIRAHGRISVFERDGKYQMYVTMADNVGYGDLYTKFEELKSKLALKGYFDEERKRPIPHVGRAALVTSTTGAVIRDVLNISRERSPFTDFVVIPAAVQGADAPRSIADGIRKANSLKGIDVIIVARGGGSMEDLWSFNEEVVADAIFESKIPVISAIGHETDFTISDFVADLRASTPSHAAQIVTKDAAGLREELTGIKYTLEYMMKSKISSRMRELEYFSPVRFKQALLSEISYRQREAHSAVSRMDKSVRGMLDMASKELMSEGDKLRTLNPLNVLDRGFAVALDESGNVVSSVDKVARGGRIRVRVKDGTIEATVGNVSKG